MSLADHILTCLGDALIHADREGRITVWNPAAAALFGFTAEEALGQSLDLIIPEHLRAAHWQGYHRAMAAGTTRPGSRPAITRALTGSGEKIYVEMSFAIVRDEQDRAIGSVAMARDAGQRVAAEKALKQRLAELGG